MWVLGGCVWVLGGMGRGRVRVWVSGVGVDVDVDVNAQARRQLASWQGLEESDAELLAGLRAALTQGAPIAQSPWDLLLSDAHSSLVYWYACACEP